MALIGNSNSLAFELVPVTPSWDLRYEPERAAWAGMAIWVGGKNLCLHLTPGSTELREHLYVPLAPIVDWLVRSFPAIEFEERAADFPTTRRLHDDAARWGTARPPRGLDEDQWLDQRDEWWARHFLRGGAEGARLPDLALVRDDEHLVVTWARPDFFGHGAPTMVHEQGDFPVPWFEGRAVLEAFAVQVADWLREGGAANAYPWAGETAPLDVAQATLPVALTMFTGRPVVALQELCRATGFDDLLRRLGLVDVPPDPAASPQCQILRDLSPSAGTEVGDVVIEMGQRSTREDVVALARWRRARAIALDAARSASSPIEAGQLAALELRKSLDHDGQPVADMSGLLNRLGLAHTHSDVWSPHDRMLVALRETGSLAVSTLRTPRTVKVWGQRFEAARALGHVLLDPMRSGSIGAASGPFAQETRRRRSGSFAAEFLLPESALAAASDDRLDGAADPLTFEGLLERYGVGARTAAFQLWNRGWLSTADLRDELIDQFAAF